MATPLISLLGASLGMFGVLIMRNPLRLACLAPGAEGHYQRLVLDRISRLQIRILGMLISFFGLVILSASLNALFKSTVLSQTYNGFLDLLWFSFIAAWGIGLVYLVVQGIRGKMGEHLFSWFKQYKQGIMLGPIILSPPVTPRMRKEALVFTIVYVVLVAMPVLRAILLR